MKEKKLKKKKSKKKKKRKKSKKEENDVVIEDNNNNNLNDHNSVTNDIENCRNTRSIPNPLIDYFYVIVSTPFWERCERRSGNAAGHTSI